MVRLDNPVSTRYSIFRYIGTFFSGVKASVVSVDHPTTGSLCHARRQVRWTKSMNEGSKINRHTGGKIASY
jgi:hypothetical protein